MHCLLNNSRKLLLKRDVIDSLVTCNDVTSFDTNDAAKHNSAVDLGISADRIIRSDGFKKKKVSDRNMLGFRTDAKSVLIALCKKLVQKTPIKYPVARSLSCLDPRNMASAPEHSRTMMKRFCQLVLKLIVFEKLIVMSSCSSMLTSFTQPQRVNWKTLVLKLIGWIPSFRAGWQSVIQHCGSQLRWHYCCHMDKPPLSEAFP